MNIRSFLPWPIFYFFKKLKIFQKILVIFEFLFKSDLKVSFFKNYG